MCVFSPLLDGNPVHDDGVGDFDLLFHGGGVPDGGPLDGSLVCYLAQRSDDAVGSHLLAEHKREHHSDIDTFTGLSRAVSERCYRAISKTAN